MPSVTKLLDIFNAAMSHPRDSAERDAGLRELGEAIRAQARNEDVAHACARVFAEAVLNPPKRQFDFAKDYDDWAKRAAGDTDED